MNLKKKLKTGMHRFAKYWLPSYFDKGLPNMSAQAEEFLKIWNPEYASNKESLPGYVDFSIVATNEYVEPAVPLTPEQKIEEARSYLRTEVFESYLKNGASDKFSSEEIKLAGEHIGSIVDNLTDRQATSIVGMIKKAVDGEKPSYDLRNDFAVKRIKGYFTNHLEGISSVPINDVAGTDTNKKINYFDSKKKIVSVIPVYASMMPNI